MTTQATSGGPRAAAGTATGCRVVARFRDGSVVKGTTHDFAPLKAKFHLLADGDGTLREVEVAGLKALFYVHDYDGDPARKDEYDFDAVRGHGRKAKITFDDGEVVAGYTVGYHPERQGFFVIPADPAGNNTRIFVCNGAVATIDWV